MRVNVRAVVSLVVMVSAAMLVTGCGHYVCHTTFGASTCTPAGTGIGGGTTGTGTPAAFDFFEDSGSLDAASLDTSGNFILIPNFVSPNQTGTGAFGGMVIVQKQWLYVADSSQIEAYSINGTTGALTAITGNPFVFTGTEAYSSTTDPAGKFLFVTGANNDQVWVFAINQTNGALTTVGSFSTGIGFAAYPTTDGLGTFLYVTAGNLGNKVAVFTIGSDGSLAPILGSPFSISIAHLAGEPTGKFLLGITGNGANNGFASDDHVYVFSIQSTGALTPVTNSPFATKFTPATLAVHPSGTFVYSFNQTVSGTSPMEGFQFDPTTGALSALATSPFTSLTAPAGTFDQSGAYLFMHPGTSLSAASVNTTTGALSSIGTPIANAGNPVAQSWAATDPH
jgi:6-phosphogluconolactonase (cycloisomerase 2 family)